MNYSVESLVVFLTWAKLITWLIKLPLFTKGLDLSISPFDPQNFYFNYSFPRDQATCFLLHYELAFKSLDRLLKTHSSESLEATLHLWSRIFVVSGVFVIVRYSDENSHV